MANQGFRMGEHVFLAAADDAPLSRFADRRGRPLQGAIPPDYLADKVRVAARSGPAELLWSGRFCGHGEPTYGVFVLVCGECDTFELKLAGSGPSDRGATPPYVLARPTGRSVDWFPIYDLRRHPAAEGRWLEGVEEPEIDEIAYSPSGETRFRVALGFEYPADCVSANDVSWYALGVEAIDGSLRDIIFEGETA